MFNSRKSNTSDEKIGLVLFGFLIVIVLAGAVFFQVFGLQKETTKTEQPQVNEPKPEPTDDTELVLDEEPKEHTTDEPKKPKDEFEEKYYVPSLSVTDASIAFEKDTFTTIKLSKAEEFLKTVFTKMKQIKNASVTELETSEIGFERRTTTQKLREISIDYDSLTAKHVFSKKVNDKSPVVLEESYAVSDGTYRSFVNKETQEKEVDFVAHAESTTRDNLLSLANINLRNRSPFHLLEDFQLAETRPQDLKTGENQDFYLFYKENEEDIFGTKHYELEAYLFDKTTHEPVRYVRYEKQTGEETTDYAMKEIIYSDFGSTSKVKVPAEIQTKALGLKD